MIGLVIERCLHYASKYMCALTPQRVWIKYPVAYSHSHPISNMSLVLLLDCDDKCRRSKLQQTFEIFISLLFYRIYPKFNIFFSFIVVQVIFNVIGSTYSRDFAKELIPVMLFIKVYRDVRHLLINWGFAVF